MARPYKQNHFPHTGNVMPRNLHNVQKSSKFYGLKFTYKKPYVPAGETKSKTLEGAESWLIRETSRLNRHYEGIKLSEQEGQARNENRLDSYYQEFFAYEQTRKGTEKDSKHDHNGKLALIKNFKMIAHKSTFEIRNIDLANVWESMSPHTQSNSRATFRGFITYLQVRELVPNLKMNLFVSEKAGGLPARPKPPTKRPFLTMQAFNAIDKKATELGFEFLSIAMNVSLCTWFRQGDLITMKWGEHITDTFVSKIANKSMARKNTQAHRAVFILKQHEVLADWIAKARKRHEETGCPYLLSHEFQSTGQGKHKEHPNQVTQGYLCKAWQKTLDAMPEYKNVPTDERPNFHKIRALCLDLAVNYNGLSMDDASENLAHTNLAVTTGHYSRNKVKDKIHTYAIKREDYDLITEEKSASDIFFKMEKEKLSPSNNTLQ